MALTHTKRKSKKDSFKKTVFPNGLTLLSERQQMKSLAIGIWIKTGTRYEGGQEAGVSHFLEHMLFKGTPTRSALQIAREVDQVGGEFNAFTAREYTCFHIYLLNRDLELALDILSDVLLNSNFDAEELERERKVILQEISMVDESPEELAYDMFFERLYGRHGLGKPILGNESSIRRMSRGDLVKFFRKHYAPERTIVSVVGDVSHATVKKKLRALSRAKWTGRSKLQPKKEIGFQPAPPLKLGQWWSIRPMEQVHIIWGVPGPSHASKDRYAAHLLNVYLGGGMSSVLFQEIREKNGLAYTVYSSLSPFTDSGVFTVYVATSMHQVPLCLRLIEETIAKVKKDLLSSEELKTVKDSLKGTILLSSDSTESRMFSIARNEIFLNQHISLEKICEHLDRVTPREIRRVARKILRTDRKSILFLGPKPRRQMVARLKPLKFI